MWSSFRHLIAPSRKAKSTSFTPKHFAIVMSARIDESNREFVFAVVHVFEMLTALKANYYAAWYGERSKP
jgi:hypothetical protein